MKNAANEAMLQRVGDKMLKLHEDSAFALIMEPVQQPGLDIDVAYKCFDKAFKYYAAIHGEGYHKGTLVQCHVEYIHLMVIVFNEMECREGCGWEPDDLFWVANAEDEPTLIPRSWLEEIGYSYNLIDEEDHYKDEGSYPGYIDAMNVTETEYSERTLNCYRYERQCTKALFDYETNEWMDTSDIYYQVAESSARAFAAIIDAPTHGVVVDVHPAFLHVLCMELAKSNTPLWYIPEGADKPIKIMQPSNVNLQEALL